MLLIAGLVFLAGAILTFALGVHIFRDRRRRLAEWLPAHGTVSRTVEDRSPSGYPVTTYLVSFMSRNGSMIECEPAGAMNMRMGKEVELIYDPNSPRDAEIAGAYSSLIYAVLTCSFSLFFLGAALVSLRAALMK